MLSSTQILPHPSCPIHQLTHQGHTVFVIEVTPFAVPPVVKVNGTAWIRQGTDDSITFSNPGGPYGQASQGELGEHSDYRNPALTRLLVELGYVERAGRGLRRVRSLLKRNGHPPLEVETNGFTSITLRRRR